MAPAGEDPYLFAEETADAIAVAAQEPTGATRRKAEEYADKLLRSRQTGLTVTLVLDLMSDVPRWPDNGWSPNEVAAMGEAGKRREAAGPTRPKPKPKRKTKKQKRGRRK